MKPKPNIELKNILKYWIRSKDKDTHIIPSDTIYVTIDKEAVKKSGMMMANDSIPDRMVISLKGKSALYKGDLMMLEMIAQCNWVRPIYVASTVGQDNYMNLGDNFVQEGLANRITPFTTNKPGAKNFDTQKTYNNVMNRYKYGGLSRKDIYIDETIMRMCYTHRRIMAQLALHLISEGDKQKASNVLQKAEKELPPYNIPYNYMNGGLDIARAYAMIGQTAKAKEVINAVWRNGEQYLNWYMSLEGTRFANSMNDCMLQMYILRQTAGIMDLVDKQEAAKQEKKLNRLFKHYQEKGGTMPIDDELE